MVEDAPWSRLHPVSPLFSLLSAAKETALLALPLIIFGGERGAWYALVFVGAHFITDVLRYVATRYRLDAEGLALRQGLLMRQQRVIPYGRIQNVDRVQGPLHRLCGVVELRVETASGGEAEARLRVLGAGTVDQLEARLAASRGSARQTAAPPERTLASCGTGDLLLLGALSGRGLAMIAGGIAAVLQFADEEAPRQRLQPLLEQLDDQSLLPWLLLGVVALALLLSIGWTLLMLHGFRLSARGSELHLACGLLARAESTIPRRRIQFLSLRQGPLLRLIGRGTVRIETAGATQTAPVSRRWFVPIARLEAIPPILAQVQDAVDFAAIDWHPLSPRGRRRMLRRGALLGLLLGLLPLAWAWPPWLPALGLALGGTYGWLQGRAYAWSAQPGGMLLRSGVLVRSTSALPFARGQALALRRSPLDRLARMATLEVDSAGAGPAGHRIRIPMLELAQALRLHRSWRRAIAGSRFEW